MRRPAGLACLAAVLLLLAAACQRGAGRASGEVSGGSSRTLVPNPVLADLALRSALTVDDLGGPPWKVKTTRRGPIPIKPGDCLRELGAPMDLMTKDALVASDELQRGDAQAFTFSFSYVFPEVRNAEVVAELRRSPAWAECRRKAVEHDLRLTDPTAKVVVEDQGGTGNRLLFRPDPIKPVGSSTTSEAVAQIGRVVVFVNTFRFNASADAERLTEKDVDAALPRLVARISPG